MGEIHFSNEQHINWLFDTKKKRPENLHKYSTIQTEQITFRNA